MLKTSHVFSHRQLSIELDGQQAVAGHQTGEQGQGDIQQAVDRVT